ncbi:hypothetical protein C9374_000967 [Naegleria lovaniensis]|uniref:Uncharacterized protein n=1 Tax=Naegleria lovaniensis TaxID=51637 RepID=A0AA88GSK7_NAELO|nr:uncharacterized protein C9374_000967 [Naegleria lovaniensis]KAG2388117.1 hypothetical protein C9374_000967 [Naegleria lovaniensis]
MHSTPYLLNAVSSTTPSSSSTPSHFSTRAESSVTNTSSPSSLFHPGNSSSVVVENHPQVAPNNKHNTNADIDYLSCNLLPMRSSSVLVHSSSSGGVEHEIHTHIQEAQPRLHHSRPY